MSTMVRDMTKGNTTNLLLEFAVPMLIGNIFQQVYNVVDSAIVGKYIGADALAAVGSTGSVNFLFFSVCIGVGSGSGIVASRYFGGKEHDNVKRVVANSCYIMMIASFIMALLGFILSGAVLHILNTPANIFSDAAMYLQLMCLGIPLVGLFNYGSSMLRALGDSKTPLIFLLVSCFVNIGLDYLFVVEFGMGIKGAAVATLIAQAIAGIGCLIFSYITNEYFKIEKELRSFNLRIIKECVRMGSMLALQMGMIAVSCIALQRYVNGFGSTVVAAFTATGRIEQIIQQPYNSLGMAISTHAGQNLGAGNHKRIKEGFNKGLLIAFVFSVLMLPVMQFFGEQIISIFVDEQEVIALGAKGLRITSVFYFALGSIYVSRGILNGIGDAAFAFINGFVEMVGRILLPALLAGSLFGVWGLWLSGGLTWFISGLFAVIRYRGKLCRKDEGIVSKLHNSLRKETA
ncbi:MAG: MATE family efflux transporter [Saccharofermentans sp.]|nr:MATE family efflux transporter [Saccharofermentans sp.]